MRVFGVQFGYAETTLFSVFSFRTPFEVRDAETAVELLINQVLRPCMMGDVHILRVRAALALLSQGGYDSDRSYPEGANDVLDPSMVSTLADEQGFSLGELFPEEVIQDAGAWMLNRRTVHVYKSDGSHRVSRKCNLPFK